MTPSAHVLLTSLCLAVFTGCGDDDPAEGEDMPTLDPLSLRSDAALGRHLVDGEGRTLYAFATDLPAGGGAEAVSRCAENLLPSGTVCQVTWPIFHASELLLSGELDPNDFGEIDREDGSMQTTFKGWPLYYFAGDAKPGDTNGEGVGGVWFVLPEPFYTVALRNQKLDPMEAAPRIFVTDPQGRTLYRFENDVQGQPGQMPVSNCHDNLLPSGAVCQQAWPPFLVDATIAPSTLAANELGTISRPEGGTQLTYQGWPLYYFVQDSVPGDTNGEGVGGVWFVLGPND